MTTAGTLLAGKYRLKRQLGEGAMGAVWAAVNEATSRDVAVKLIIRPEPEFRIRLQREAKALGALRHKNIIDVYDIEQSDKGDPFLVMQLLTGETLADLLVRKRRLEVPEAARIGRDIARALAVAHQVPIVHRDLKPANIFLHREPGEDSEIVVKVLDFGVAKNLAVSDGMHTAVGGTVGSPLYMSPEQMRAQRDVDHRADLWALGVVLFEMLAGQRPFEGTAQELCVKILTGEIPRLDRLVRRLDPGMAALVERCLRRDRAERPASASEVAATLERYASARAPMPSGYTEGGAGAAPQSGPYAPMSAPVSGGPGAPGGAAGRPGSGSYPAYSSGPYPAMSAHEPAPRAGSGAYPAYGSGPYPAVTGPEAAPRAGSGPHQAYGSGPYPAAAPQALPSTYGGPLESISADLEPLDEDDARTIPIQAGVAQAALQRVQQQRAAQAAAGQAAAAQHAGSPHGMAAPQGQGAYPGGGNPGVAAQAAQGAPGAWNQQQHRSGESWPRSSANPSLPAIDPHHESGPWSAAPGSQAHAGAPPRQPQPSYAEMQGPGHAPRASRPDPGEAHGWAQGGTVKLQGNEAQVFRNKAVMQDTAPLPRQQAPEPVGMPAHPTAPLSQAMPGSNATSTTTPLISGSLPAHAPPMGTVSAPMFDERRRRDRKAAAIVGILVGLAVAAGVMFVISMNNADSRPDLTPASEEANHAPSPTFRAAELPAPPPTPSTPVQAAAPEPQPTPVPSAASSGSTPRAAETSKPEAAKPSGSATAKPSTTATPSTLFSQPLSSPPKKSNTPGTSMKKDCSKLSFIEKQRCEKGQ
ncbi:serine/threonine-protein kinase [Chondromyces apiculatus]|uniref:Serine/threonine-protein kinase pkn3 n=1 Tax=Chondromyces apiculatus DSM 436 TaxID=1192034 RepID=A0A017STQ5_9BACT|nr:serine/threonine-protein kinase [Chondromyces apiculatus]EYF00354.1 Serine/threonine-protein kinase pkn3 [Chondromyces apiculatus DSM 436]